MGIFISVPVTVECIVASVIFAALYCPTAYKVLGILQSLQYRGKKLFAWAAKKNNKILLRQALLFMLCALSSAVISLCFFFVGRWAAVIGLAPYALFFIAYVWADKKFALRSPASPTPRFKRLYIVFAFISAVLIYLAFTLLNFADCVWGNALFANLKYCVLSVFPLLTLPIAALANCIDKIYETPKNAGYVKKARARMAASSLKVIGITGSYGKTSVKNILARLLAVKYRVLATPRSHNTPLGLALTINSADLGNYDVFIAEMGARNAGDILELCGICPPDYSVITGICPQHLESFGTIENIVRAKGEILSATLKSAAIAPDCEELFADYPVKRAAVCTAENIKCSPAGVSFTLRIGDERAETSSQLLGAHSARNIALAASVAYELGVSLEEIAEAVKDIPYVEHRLQLIESGGVNILDDGYNSNVKGAEAALETLRSFGGRKIAVTPGLVELGVLEESENFELGKKLVGLDLVILVGETIITPVKEGYISAGGEREKLRICPHLKAAEEVIKSYVSKGDAVLFLNDLPDIY